MDQISRQKEHFNSISTDYFAARRSKNHLFLKKLLWDFALKDVRLSNENRKIRLLEPMCGYSEGYEIVRSIFPDIELEYEGFDFSEEILRLGKESHPDLNISLKDVTQFESEPIFDAIILIGGLHHVPDHSSKILKALNNALLKNGTIILLEPTQNNFFFKWVRNRIYKKNRIFDEQTERAFDYQDLLSQVNAAGFKIQKRLACGLSSYVLFYNPDAFPWLNVGGLKLVKFLFKLDQIFMKNFIGRYFSFATLIVAKKETT